MSKRSRCGAVRMRLGFGEPSAEIVARRCALAVAPWEDLGASSVELRLLLRCRFPSTGAVQISEQAKSQLCKYKSSKSSMKITICQSERVREADFQATATRRHERSARSTLFQLQLEHPNFQERKQHASALPQLERGKCDF